MPARVIDYCRRTGQPAPQNDADVMATVYVSLAYKYRYVLEQLIAVSGGKWTCCISSAAARSNALLNQMTANAIGRPVIAGPAEATATGNAIAQLIAIGEIASVAEARAMRATRLISSARAAEQRPPGMRTIGRRFELAPRRQRYQIAKHGMRIIVNA